MANRTVLATDIIRGIVSLLTKNDDELVIRFNRKAKRDACCRWLKELQKDATRSPEERYETVFRQLDPLRPDQNE